MFNPRHKQKEVKFSESTEANPPKVSKSSFFKLFSSRKSIIKPSDPSALIERKSIDIEGPIDTGLAALANTSEFKKNTELLSGFLHALAISCQELLQERPLQGSQTALMRLMIMELYEAAFVSYPDRAKELKDTDPINLEQERDFLQYMEDYWKFGEESASKTLTASRRTMLLNRDNEVEVISDQFKKYADDPKEFLNWVVGNFVTQFQTFFKDDTDRFAELLYRIGETFQNRGISHLSKETSTKLADVFMQEAVKLHDIESERKKFQPR